MKYRHLKYIDDSVQIFDIAREYGVKSTLQLSTFLECAKHEGYALFQVFGEDSTNPEFRSKYMTVRKLMQGGPKRTNDGLGLLEWGETVYRRERAVLLTTKGKELLEKIFKVVESV